MSWLILLLAGLSPEQSLELGHPRHEIRQEAERRFVRAGWRALPLAMKLTSHPDCEIASRAKRLVARYTPPMSLEAYLAAAELVSPAPFDAARLSYFLPFACDSEFRDLVGSILVFRGSISADWILCWDYDAPDMLKCGIEYIRYYSSVNPKGQFFPGPGGEWLP